MAAKRCRWYLLLVTLPRQCFCNSLTADKCFWKTFCAENCLNRLCSNVALLMLTRKYLRAEYARQAVYNIKANMRLQIQTYERQNRFISTAINTCMRLAAAFCLICRRYRRNRTHAWMNMAAKRSFLYAVRQILPRICFWICVTANRCFRNTFCAENCLNRLCSNVALLMPTRKYLRAEYARHAV